MRTLLLIVAVLAQLAASSTVFAHEAQPDEEFDQDKALTQSQAVLGAEIGNYTFTASTGDPIDLSRFRGKPLVVSMIYTSCNHFCPLITESLHRAVSGAREVFGDEAFTVVTIGFDTRYDTPRRMRSYAASRGIDLPNWHFASGIEAAVAAISRDTGFQYLDAPWGYEHLAQVSVIDAEGRVFHQVYGTSFEPPALIEPLKDLVYGRNAQNVSLDGLLDRIRLFCTVYDPRRDRYHFDYSIFVGIAIGALVLSGIGLVVGRNAWRLWRPGSLG
jgi:protein SCO1/2